MAKGAEAADPVTIVDSDDSDDSDDCLITPDSPQGSSRNSSTAVSSVEDTAVEMEGQTGAGAADTDGVESEAGSTKPADKARASSKAEETAEASGNSHRTTAQGRSGGGGAAAGAGGNLAGESDAVIRLGVQRSVSKMMAKIKRREADKRKRIAERANKVLTSVVPDAATLALKAERKRKRGKQSALAELAQKRFRDNTQMVPAPIMIRGFQKPAENTANGNNHLDQLNGVYRFYTMHCNFPAYKITRKPPRIEYYVYWHPADNRWYIGPELGSDSQITCYLDFHDVTEKYHLPTDHSNRRLQYWNTKEWTKASREIEIMSLDSQYEVGVRVKCIDYNCNGVIRLRGETGDDMSGWLGVELDHPVSTQGDGMCNGVYNGRQKFDCKPKHGAFIPIGKATPLGQDRTISALQEILVAALPPPRKPKAKKMPVNDSSSIVA